MVELLSSLHHDELLGLLLGGMAIVGGFACAICSRIGGCLLKVRETALKQEMVKAGLSAEDIRTVIEAGSAKSRKALLAESRYEA